MYLYKLCNKETRYEICINEYVSAIGVLYCCFILICFVPFHLVDLKQKVFYLFFLFFFAYEKS